MKTETTELKQRWQELLQLKPTTRIRDAAAELGVSEAELLVTDCGHSVIRLEGDWKELLLGLPALGKIMGLTRNHAAVHERKGFFRDIAFFHGMGQVVGPDVDLRLFMSHWHLGFAIREETKEGLKRSLQFFDQDGTAVHKVFLQPESNVAAFDALVLKFLSPNQEPAQVTLPLPEAKPDLPDAEIDQAGFQAGWEAMQDTHEFFGLLQKFKVGRLQALRLAPKHFVQSSPLGAFRKALTQAATTDLPIMIFVGNAGCLQIHTGPVKNLKTWGPWFNVLDEDFNLHLREDLIAQAWIVRKPTRDGVVTSLELYDAQGENLLLLFGKRKPGQPEDPQWRALVETFTVSVAS